ncbi:ExeM/NucH family extracellular endonuclease, partial [Tamilnaduibacter salinus]|uniref:ExeM/NucH family extracellular endonuclease n=1 Tax=Tamilnaduibacter salinus TaxID=1484056 RepID=UPI001B80C926
GDGGHFLVGNSDGLSAQYAITPDLAINSNFFENSSLTVALVKTSSLAGDSVTGDELVIDALALNDGDSGDSFFFDAPVIGPDGPYFPAGASRNVDGLDSDSASDFSIASFSLDGSHSPMSSGTDGGDGDGGGSVASCGDPAEAIWAIQGSGATSPQEGQARTVEGIVVGDFQSTTDGLKGFFIQEEDTQADGDPTTSDGLFVYDNGFGVDVAEGDLVRVSGTVTEYYGLTQLASVASVEVCATNAASATPAPLTLPESVNGELERYEGMQVALQHPMTVSQNYFLGRYGQLTLSSPDDSGQAGRLFKPTNQYPAGTPEAVTLAEANARRLLILDDGMDIGAFGDNPEPVPYLGPVPPMTLRAGDTVGNLVGVIDFGRINSAPPGEEARDYRLHPTQAPVFSEGNPRKAAPETVNGDLTVASFNVLNYFNGDGLGGGFPTARGADTPEELERQERKIVQALVAMDADVVGLMEIENDGYGPNSAIANLVDAVNGALGDTVYDYVDPGTSAWGGDAIAVGLIYKPARVDLAGGTSVVGLETGEFTQGPDQRHRKPMVATFEEKGAGERFTVVVNHFKSKGSLTGIPGDEAQGDGQGNNNLSRTNAANALADWLTTAPTGSDDPDILVIGDLNAYAEEDPILALEAAGYSDQIEAFAGKAGYSYIFDGEAGYLDHALVSETLVDQVTGATEWHINTDEPAVIDYDQNFNPAGYYDGNKPYRASDHDPVLVGLDLGGVAPLEGDVNGDGAVDYGDFSALSGALGSVAGDVTYLESADIDGDGDVDFIDYQAWYPLYQARD